MSLIIKLYRRRLNKMPAYCKTLTKILNRKFGIKKKRVIKKVFHPFNRLLLPE